jgi:hypothetical protein
MLQVLISIQALILGTASPIACEPGHEDLVGVSLRMSLDTILCVVPYCFRFALYRDRETMLITLTLGAWWSTAQ